MRHLLFYHYPLSRSTRVLWTMLELCLSFDVKKVDLLKGEHLENEFANPNKNVPAIEFTTDDGTRHIMFESSAICSLLAEQNAMLIPNISWPLKQRAMFHQIFQWAAVSMDSVLWQMRVLVDFREGKEPDLIASNIARWNEIISPQLEKVCANTFCCNNTFSLADIFLTYNIFWARRYKALTVGPAATKYLNEHRKRPGWIEATKDKNEWAFDKSKL